MTVSRKDQMNGWEQVVLRTARNLIETTGWCQGELSRDHNGDPISSYDYKASSWSLAGAINLSFWIHGPVVGNKRILRDKKVDILRRLRDRSADHLQRWNDEPGRQAAHVVDLLEQVAASYGDVSGGGGHCDSLNVVKSG